MRFKQITMITMITSVRPLQRGPTDHKFDDEKNDEETLENKPE